MKAAPPFSMAVLFMASLLYSCTSVKPLKSAVSAVLPAVE